jgi:eukaryotic-like serine/threonine-protein kinase
MAVMRPPAKSVHIEDKRYEKIAELATGGMATVYFGRMRAATGVERRVAIKEMLPHLAKSAEFVRMFFDEARLASRIHHPNVVATLDMTEADGSHALILEYVEGPSLQQIMKYQVERGATIPLDITLRIFLDLLAGLHAAHELIDEDGRALNLVHRDVSPQNMLVGTDGITKITDFGIARAESRLSTTRTGNVKGKVPYMSPEQVKSLPIDRRTDVYAAGVILWEMLTSQRLVQGETDVAMIYQVTDREATTPREWNPGIPEPIAKVCLRALEKRVENRYMTAVQFIDALEDAARASEFLPATPRAVGNYVRGLALHRSAVEHEADHRRRSQLDAHGKSPESSGSTSMLNLVSAPRFMLEGPKRPVMIMVAAASGVMMLGLFIWLGFSGSNTSSSTPAASPPAPVTREVAAAPPTPAPTPTNPAPVVPAATSVVPNPAPAPTDDLVVEEAPKPSASTAKAPTTPTKTTPTTTSTNKAKALTAPIKKKPVYEPRGL